MFNLGRLLSVAGSLVGLERDSVTCGLTGDAREAMTVGYQPTSFSIIS